MVSPSAHSASRYRRRILGLGALATGALYVIGAPIYNDRIETDLERRVPAELAEAGFDGFTITFSGQDGDIECARPLDDPDGVVAAAYLVRGVRAIEISRACRVNTRTVSSTVPPEESEATEATENTDDDTGSTTTVTEPSTTVDDAELVTVSDIVAANPDLAFLSVLLEDVDIGRFGEPVTLFAPSNAAFDALPADAVGRLQNEVDLLRRVLSHHMVAGSLTSTDLVDGELASLDGGALSVVTGDELSVGGAMLVDVDITASNGVVHVVDSVIVPADVELQPEAVLAPAAAAFDGTAITLTGVVASEVEREVVVGTAVDAAGLDNVVDEMTVDPDTGLDAATSQRLALLIGAMPGNLAAGEAGFNGTDLYATGTYVTDAGRDAFVEAATTVDVEAVLMPPPDATDEDAVDLEEQLNAFVAENPILFEPSSSVLDDSAFAVIDRLAGDAQQFSGITITIEGHTDSDGVPIENLQLSQNRAEAVRDALIERGIGPGSIEAVGFGSEQPVLVDGAEDKAASRRVEFRVVTAS